MKYFPIIALLYGSACTEETPTLPKKQIPSILQESGLEMTYETKPA